MAKILIVEDEADAAEPLAVFLRNAGHEVTCAANGRKAMGEIINNPPDVVLLDLFLPEMDGVSLLEVMRSYLRLQSLPVVVFTGLGDSPLLDRARHQKVNSILLKGKATFEDIQRALEEAVFRAPG